MCVRCWTTIRRQSSLVWIVHALRAEDVPSADGGAESQISLRCDLGSICIVIMSNAASSFTFNRKLSVNIAYPYAFLLTERIMHDVKLESYT